MRKIILRCLLSGVIAAFCLIALPLQAQTSNPVKAKPLKTTQPTKERLVLMPLRVGEEIQNMLGAMETALAEGLQQQYVVFAGQEVEQKQRDIFKKESAHKNCDETRCMEDIAIAFQSELIATANVIKIEGGYLLALSIRNVMDNKAVYNKSMPCENCSVFQVVNKLKELSGAPAPTPESVVATSTETTAVSSNDPEVALWNEVKVSNMIDDYKSYLSQYPKGKYVVLAKSRIKKMQENAANEVASKEQQSWEVAEQAGSEVIYQKYLKDYPQGRYAELAQIRIRKLQTNQAVRGEQTYSDSASQELKVWDGANTMATEGSYKSYLAQYPNGKYVALAKSNIKRLRDEIPQIKVIDSIHTFVIDTAHTRPRFEYRHFGYSSQVSWFDTTTGTITIDRAAKTGSVDVVIDAKSVNTGYELFDGHIQDEDFFDTTKYPTITFKSDKMRFEGDKLIAVDGNLTIKGITKPVTLTVTSFICMPHPMAKKDACGANATVQVKRSDFNMAKYTPYVSDEVTLTIPVESIKQ